MCSILVNLNSANETTRIAVQRAYGTALQQNCATYTYSPSGQRQTVKDANNNLSTFAYDGFDRLAKLRFPVATTGAGQSSTTDYEQYGYDAAGNRISLRKRDGRTIGYSYDALNRLRVKTVPASASGAPGYSVYHGYAVRGLMTHARFSSDSGPGVTNSYDGFGRLLVSSSNLGGVTRNVSSAYDARGNRTRITHPDGAFFEYAWDGADRLFHLSENGPSITLASLFFDGQGRRDQLARDVMGATTGYGYDPVSRLAALSHDLDGTGSTNDATLGFSYNPASQIVSRSLTNNAYEFPLTNSTRSYAVNGRNQYTQVGGTTHAWDANGNLYWDGATIFGYDTENRLVSASGARNATLAYDPLGRLYQVTTTTPSATTRFVYDGDRLIAEYDGSGTLRHRYVHGAGIDEPLVWYEGAPVSSATRRYLHANHQGSIVAVSASSGAMQQVRSYDAYGVTATANTLRFQYTGQAAILELGLLYYKARFYNPALGRFMQTDPIGYEDDFNLYAYVRNDPLNNVDPTGRTCTSADGKYDCKVDHVPKDATKQQLKDIAKFEKRYTAAVNKLMSNPDRQATVKVPGQKAFTVTAGEVGKSLVKAEVKAAPGTSGGASTRGDLITLHDGILSQGNRTPQQLGSFQAMGIVHEGIHWTGWGPMPDGTRSATGERSALDPNSLGREPLRSLHQDPYNNAATELLWP